MKHKYLGASHSRAMIGHVSTPSMVLERAIIIDFSGNAKSLVRADKDGIIYTHDTTLIIDREYWNWVQNFNTRIRL